MTTITAQENEIRLFLLQIKGGKIGVDSQVTVDNARFSFEYLCSIMQRQETWIEKIDKIVAFRVITKGKSKALTLQLKMSSLRTSSWLTVSWKKGTEKKRKLIDPLISAMRNAISSQCKTWGRMNLSTKICTACKHVSGSLQVDHVISFNQLRTDFLETKHPIPTEFSRSLKGYRFVKASPFVRDWKRFHQKNATYQWLCKSCNCRKGDKNDSVQSQDGSQDEQ